MKNLEEILATTIMLAYDMRVTFRERMPHDPAGTVRACYALRLIDGELEAAGERVYGAAFLQDVPDDVLKQLFQQDADDLIDNIPK